MPRLTDLSRVLAILDRDRAWAAYAIGDLAREFVAHCEWHTAGEGRSLLLLYRGFDPPILFAMGAVGDLVPLFREIDVPALSLHLRPDTMPALSPTYRTTSIRPMWRMVLPAASFRSASLHAVVPLDESHYPAITALYDDGRGRDEAPIFFQPSMLRQGTFRGIWGGPELIAVAGTHLFSRDLGICAIGNVYTRRDRRRQGLGARVTSAVVQHAVAEGIETIVLNVSQANSSARRIYEQLGFRCHCEYLEGEARARGSRPEA